MEIRIAQQDDLAELKLLTAQVVNNMNNQNIPIWNEYYPAGEFENDIKNNELYVATENGKIAGVYCITKDMSCSWLFYWKEKHADSLYLTRILTNPEFANQGIASSMIKHAEKLSKQQGHNFLRLIVAEVNTPAINLYTKNGFVKVEGVAHNEYITKCNNTEFGFEKEL